MTSGTTEGINSSEDLRQHQLEGLQATLNRVNRNVRYYHELFDAIGLVPEDVRSLDDLGKIPYTTKDTLRENYPYGMFAVKLQEIVRIHSSAGTTGRPTVVGFNRNDMRHWREVSARVLSLAGVDSCDILLIAFGSSFFTGGAGLHLGAEEIGATLIPTSSVDLRRHAFMIRDYHVDTLISTPCYALALAETFQSLGFSPDEIPLRKGLFGGEPWDEGIRASLEESLRIKAYDHYGLSEIYGSGVAAECPCRSGLHIFEDQVIPEVIDPSTGEVLAPGREGELVLTTITKEAMPLIRYRTGDLTTLIDGGCGCGHPYMGIRMARVTGRTGDSIEVSGIEISAGKIEEVLSALFGTLPRFQVVVTRESTNDIVEVHTELPEGSRGPADRTPDQLEEALKKEIGREIVDLLGSTIRIRFYPPMGLSGIVEHRTKVIDRRFLKR
ncbi:MAG TPA: phenylacetate--CoA ligase [Deltaproteobacteria bacterium]|nr:phenylacetate--CoA ligase [Deltaproteobacteria bacterium]HPR55646.1 phenylacetate--CoA ligase [Deltaproteobacteria bacterium]HXK47419.1 phenylacetate--CoA ligase [Deltaproteobacteria bacterium]